MSSSSNINSYHQSDNIIAREHIHNFRNLPFFIYFTSPYSPLPPHLTYLNLSAFFRHIPTEAVPLPPSPPPQRLILIETEFHYRYIIDRRQTRRNSPSQNAPTNPPSPQSSTSLQSSQRSHSSDSSLPPLIPIPQTRLSPEPPAYTESIENLPRYRRPEDRHLIQRSIDALERDYFDFEESTTRHRDLTITRINLDTELQIRDFRERTEEEIERLELLLNF